MRSYANNIWKVYLFQFLLSLAFFSAVIVPFFTDFGGLTFSQIMILETLFQLAAFAFEVPTGVVADRFGRKMSLCLGALSLAVAAAVYATAPLFWLFALSEVIWALGAAFISGADEALLYDSLKMVKKEGTAKRALGSMGSLARLGGVAGALIGAVIAGYFGLRAPMLATSGAAVVAFFVGLTLEEPEVRESKETVRATSILSTGVNYLIKHPAVRALAIDSVFVTAIIFMIVWVYQARLGAIGVGIAWFGVVNAVMQLGEVFVLRNFSALQGVFGHRNYLFISALLPAVCFVLLAFTTNWVLSALLMVFIGTFGLTRGTLLSSYIHKHIESDCRATVISSVAMLQRILQCFVYLLIGPLVDWNLGISLVALGGLGIAAALVSRVEEKMLIED